MPTTDSFFPFLTTSCVCSAHICQLLVRFMSRQTGFKWLLLHTFATHRCVSCLARRITSGFYRVYLPVVGTLHALPDAHSFARSLAHSRALGKVYDSMSQNDLSLSYSAIGCKAHGSFSYIRRCLFQENPSKNQRYNT